jgi:hypothetical protein
VIATTGDNGLLILKLEPHTSYRLTEEFLGSYLVEPLEGEDLAEALAEEARDLEPPSPELQRAFDEIEQLFGRRSA